MAEGRIQRRLAAIISADVVGYSRMMGSDEAGTLARLKALRAEFLHPKVAEYGGRIVKTTGDGTLIEFPSAVDAVSHAVDVQRGMAERNAGLREDQRIEIRLGVNVGDIIIDEDDIFGDGVNVAARLEALAEPGDNVAANASFFEAIGRVRLGLDGLGYQFG
jgi:adenylate cyclase